jgi:hypothetical protein
MIQVTVGTNTSRTKVVASGDKTPKQILDQAGVNYSTATVHLDGASLTAKQMNQSLTELGITESCYLIAVVKAENN